MPVINVTIEQTLFNKLQTIAEAQHISVSEWVTRVLSNEIESYPQEFVQLAGSLNEYDLIREKQVDYNKDSTRENF